MDQEYRKQVRLLLNVLPFVAEEQCFALHGGTAINLFIRDMPRLSVDIDLTYLPLEDRPTTVVNIVNALARIKVQIEARLANCRVTFRKDAAKLIITSKDATVKLEVNLTGRGTYGEPQTLALCERAQNEYDLFCEIQVVPTGQLYGGKICAALDRQHPRDLFDIKFLLANEGITKDILAGFLYCLLGSERPINEVLNPNFLCQKAPMTNQFNGMTSETFSYEEFEGVRSRLVQLIQNQLTIEDRYFLLNFKDLTPVWENYNFAKFPSVQWKLQNLENLKRENPEKHQKLYRSPKTVLFDGPPGL